MGHETVQDFPTVEARYEFRVFMPALEPIVEQQFDSLMAEAGESQEANLYLLAPGVQDVNIKIRDGQLDVKRRIAGVEGFERWLPESAGSFRLPPTVASAIEGLDDCPAKDAPEFVRRFLAADPRHCAMHVLKTRRHFERDDLLGEVCDLLVNGAALHSVAIESEQVDALRTLRNALGLDSASNVSYVRGLKQLAGLEPLPAHSPWRAAPYG